MRRAYLPKQGPFRYPEAIYRCCRLAKRDDNTCKWPVLTFPSRGLANPGSNLSYMPLPNRITDDQRRHIVSEWRVAQAKGERQAEFCQRHGVPPRTLRDWCSRFAPTEPDPM